MPKEKSVVQVFGLYAVLAFGMGISNRAFGCVTLTGDQETNSIFPDPGCTPDFKGESIEAANNISAQAQANLAVYRLRYDAKLKRYACENLAGHVGYNKIKIKDILSHPRNGECANLKGADLRNLDLSKVTLSGADLRFADLTGATLPNRKNMMGSKLQGAKIATSNSAHLVPAKQ